MTPSTNHGLRRGHAPSAPGASAAPRDRRRSLVATACLCSATLAAVAATTVGAVSAPAAAAPAVSTARDNDRTLKLDAIDRLGRAPQTLVLGSSRAKRAEPAYLQRLTGRTGFNAAVIGGTAADAWVMTRYLADCFPLHKRRYLWFVDVGVATNGVNPDLRADPRSRDYLDPTADPAVRRRACGPGDTRSSTRYLPDGSLGPHSVRNLPEKARHLDESVAKLVASVRAHPAANSGNLDPKRYVWFEKALAFMNSRGERPVIVLNPIYPTVLAELRKVGFPARRTSRAYLAQLHARFDFVVVDAEDIHRWGGSRRDFADPTHINDANMRRLLRYVVAHSDGALR